MKICKFCKKEYNGRGKNFCSQSCNAKFHNKPKVINERCLNCGNTPKRIGYKFCSVSCQQQFQNDKKIKRWLSGENFIRNGGNQTPQWIRKYLLKETNNKCSKCGWGEMNEYTKTFPLDIDHIDGNAYNNLRSNLRVLCPNCHSLTHTYKFAGKRKSSRKLRNKPS